MPIKPIKWDYINEAWLCELCDYHIQSEVAKEIHQLQHILEGIHK